MIDWGAHTVVELDAAAGAYPDPGFRFGPMNRNLSHYGFRWYLLYCVFLNLKQLKQGARKP